MKYRRQAFSQNKYKNTFLSWLLCCGLFFIFLPIVQAESDEIVTLRPSPQVSNLVNEKSPAQNSEPYINRIGLVSFSTDVFLPKTAESGSRRVSSMSFKGLSLSVSFFPEKQFVVIVDHVARPKPEILSLNGRIEGKEISTFSMTVTAESFLISLQDLNTATVYRVVGDTESGQGQATEIDLQKMPPRYSLPPIVPEGE